MNIFYSKFDTILNRYPHSVKISNFVSFELPESQPINEGSLYDYMVKNKKKCFWDIAFFFPYDSGKKLSSSNSFRFAVMHVAKPEPQRKCRGLEARSQINSIIVEI